MRQKYNTPTTESTKKITSCDLSSDYLDCLACQATSKDDKVTKKASDLVESNAHISLIANVRASNKYDQPMFAHESMNIDYQTYPGSQVNVRLSYVSSSRKSYYTLQNQPTAYSGKLKNVFLSKAIKEKQANRLEFIVVNLFKYEERFGIPYCQTYRHAANVQFSALRASERTIERDLSVLVRMGLIAKDYPRGRLRSGLPNNTARFALNLATLAITKEYLNRIWRKDKNIIVKDEIRQRIVSKKDQKIGTTINITPNNISELNNYLLPLKGSRVNSIQKFENLNEKVSWRPRMSESIPIGSLVMDSEFIRIGESYQFKGIALERQFDKFKLHNAQKGYRLTKRERYLELWSGFMKTAHQYGYHINGIQEGYSKKNEKDLSRTGANEDRSGNESLARNHIQSSEHPVFKSVLEGLLNTYGPDIYRSWFSKLQLSEYDSDKNSMVISSNRGIVVDKMVSQYNHACQKILMQVSGKESFVRFLIK